MSIRARFAVTAAVALSLALPAAAAAQNVAEGATVVASGTFGTNPGPWVGGSLAPFSSITDGVFLTEATQWNVGTVWWNRLESPDASLVIDLGARFDIFQLALQADNNDAYQVEYRDGAGPWVSLGYFGPSGAFGMVTRGPVPVGPFTATGFRLSWGGIGDEYLSISEFQAIGSAVAVVPEPATVLLLGTGLLALGVVGARRRRA